MRGGRVVVKCYVHMVVQDEGDVFSDEKSQGKNSYPEKGKNCRVKILTLG